MFMYGGDVVTNSPVQHKQTSWYGSFEVDEAKSNQLIKLKQTEKKDLHI